MPFAIQQITKKDWQTFREIRLEALRTEPGSFGSNFQKESEYSEADWQSFIGESSDRGLFLLKKGDAVIGVTGILRDRDDHEVASLIASYIRLEFRGLNLSRLLYQARIAWAREHHCKSVSVSHRESNLPSRRAIQKAGFEFSHQTERVWPDSEVAKELHYKMHLEADLPNR